VGCRGFEIAGVTWRSVMLSPGEMARGGAPSREKVCQLMLLRGHRIAEGDGGNAGNGGELAANIVNGARRGMDA